MAEACPLCAGEAVEYHKDRRREYLQCSNCALVFVPASFHLSADKEKAEYDKHDNQLYDPGYRRFLSRAFDPVIAHTSPFGRGLDFGCGPGPALALMFQEAGLYCAKYDLYYAPDESVLRESYDFITATEVIEHLASPGRVIYQLYQMLKPGGILVMMSKLVLDLAAFESWHYKNDQTHISFFSKATLEFLAERLDAQLEFFAPDTFGLIKP